MAVTFSTASTQYLNRSGAILSAFPISMACWFKPASVSINNPCICIGNPTGGTTNSNYVALVMPTTGNPRAQQALGNTAIWAQSGTVLVIGTWYHLVAVFTSATSRTIYVNTVSVNNTTSQSLGAMSGTVLGALYIGSISFPASGTLAWPAIYNVTLSASDVASLYNGGLGADPRVATSKDQALQSFTRLAGSGPWLDEMSGVLWTTNGTPANAPDPFSILEQRNLVVAS